MTILLTGSEGFVGRALAQELKDRGHWVLGYDLPKYDLTKPGDVLTSMEDDVDLVIHCAAVANLYDTAEDPTKTFDVNVAGTYNVMMAAKMTGKPVVYISTCCVYGPHGDYADETTYPNACEFYARSKWAGEIIIQELEKQAVILRIGTVLGPGMRPALFNYKIMDKLRKGEKVWINGDGSASRNYIYISDLVNGIATAAEKFPGGEIINLCSAEETDLHTTLRVAQEVTGIEANYEHRAPREMGDYAEHISAQKAKDLLGWECVVDYREGMARTWEWMKSEPIVDHDFDKRIAGGGINTGVGLVDGVPVRQEQDWTGA